MVKTNLSLTFMETCCGKRIDQKKHMNNNFKSRFLTTYSTILNETSCSGFSIQESILNIAWFKERG
jgi:hypothetical protein